MGEEARDWHPRRKGHREPECASNQWRTRNRKEVIDMSKMGDNHLMNAIRFASTKKAHTSRLSALLDEKASCRAIPNDPHSGYDV